jgi:hypothetical protein
MRYFLNSSLLIFILSFSWFNQVQAQTPKGYKIFLVDKMHNSYHALGEQDEVWVVTKDMVLKRGKISSIQASSFYLKDDSTYLIQMSEILNAGLVTGSNKTARIFSRVAGYVLVSVGSLCTIGALSSINEIDRAIPIYTGIAAITSTSLGVLLLRKSYITANDRDNINSKRYGLFIAESN